MNKYRIDVTGISNGNSDLNISINQSLNYNPISILKYPVGNYVPHRLGLLWDGTGFYRIDRQKNVITDSNFDYTQEWPFNEIQEETIDGELGISIPLVYTSAEYVPSLGNLGRIWWIDSDPAETNHAAPSFISNNLVNNKLWIKKAKTLIKYNDLLTKERNTVYNAYDYSLIIKLMYIQYANESKFYDFIFGNVDIYDYYIYGSGVYNWFFGCDMLQEGVFEANQGNGNLRILNPNMDGTFIDTELVPTGRAIIGNFNIDTINGINMSDLFLDTSGDGTVLPNRYFNNRPSTPPRANQEFYSSWAFFTNSQFWGPLGFGTFAPNSFPNGNQRASKDRKLLN